MAIAIMITKDTCYKCNYRFMAGDNILFVFEPAYTNINNTNDPIMVPVHVKCAYLSLATHEALTK